MEIKEILKANRITQEELANYLGITRTALNISLNHGNQKRSVLNNLKFLVAERRGLRFDIDLMPIN